LERTRQLIERIILTPVPDARGFEIELIGEIAAMVRLGQADERADSRPVSATDHALFESSITLVAGTGFEPVTFRL
jgi:site-specific DNA recombinase